MRKDFNPDAVNTLDDYMKFAESKGYPLAPIMDKLTDELAKGRFSSEREAIAEVWPIFAIATAADLQYTFCQSDPRTAAKV